jgi:hypothetical protein
MMGKDSGLGKGGARELSSKVEHGIKKPGPKKRVSFASSEEIIAPDLLVSEDSDSEASASGARFVTDWKGITVSNLDPRIAIKFLACTQSR